MELHKQQIRDALGVPPGMRIAQHIYNVNRDTETNVNIQHYHDGKFTELSSVGIDIFYQEDDYFIKKLSEHNYGE